MWVEAISQRTKVPQEVLWSIARSASKRYFEFTIQKADGSPRLIEHPSRTLKALQRLINRNLISKAPVHDAATAYSKGSKILSNAERHDGSSYTTRLDFMNFFPSFNAASVAHFFRSLSDRDSLGLTDSDIDFLTKIVCRNGRLVIGAPTSPKITNAMMYEFDEAVSQITQRYGIIYTRYADDIFLSSFEKDILRSALSDIREVVQAHQYPELTIREEKTLHLSKAGHRSVTGLVLKPEGGVSLGRERKRSIRTMTHLALTGRLKREQIQELIGFLAFALDSEPEFVARLSRKFGRDIEAWFKAGC